MIQGPFAEVNELIAGYWIIEVASKQDAINWALRSPSPHGEQECVIEIRQLFSAEDFPTEVEHEQTLRDEITKRTKGATQ